MTDRRHHAPRLETTPAEQLVEAIARRVVELLDERDDHGPATPRLVDAATLASVLAVTPEWIYDHAEQLGVRRLGTGKRPRLRFDVDEARAALAAPEASDAQPPDAPRTRRPTRRAAATDPARCSRADPDRARGARHDQRRRPHTIFAPAGARRRDLLRGEPDPRVRRPEWIPAGGPEGLDSRPQHEGGEV